MKKAEKQLSTHEMSISVQIGTGHSAKESPEIVVPHMCVNFKNMVLLVAKHVGCGYTPGEVMPHLPLDVCIFSDKTIDMSYTYVHPPYPTRFDYYMFKYTVLCFANGVILYLHCTL